ncbi:VOC family protein [Streptomyces avicenniae]|uniref:VOC family protein n=1 Tax=Streptomyces avicenniae TaxID=500153 RepID=UPI00069B402B|nr:glyoxalase [Streptomyces avicenniae]
MPGEVAFVELGVADVTLARTFYAGLFGWSFAPGPAQDGVMISGLGVPGGLHGGDQGARPVVFFLVENMDAALTKVQTLGGSVDSTALDGDPGTQARFGRFVLCRDDQGSRFGLHQPPI